MYHSVQGRKRQGFRDWGAQGQALAKGWREPICSLPWSDFSPADLRANTVLLSGVVWLSANCSSDRNTSPAAQTACQLCLQVNKKQLGLSFSRPVREVSPRLVGRTVWTTVVLKCPRTKGTVLAVVRLSCFLLKRFWGSMSWNEQCDGKVRTK